MKTVESTLIPESTNKLGFPILQIKRNKAVTQKAPTSLDKEHRQNIRNEKYLWEKREKNSNCHRCGGHHMRSQCKFANAEWYACGKKGHIAEMCKSKTSQINNKESKELSAESIDYFQSVISMLLGA